MNDTHSKHVTKMPGSMCVAGGLFVLIIVCASMRTTRTYWPADWLDGPPEHVDAIPLPTLTIDINAASAGELDLLPGIGPQLADRIIDDREVSGTFRDLDALARVPGIGPRTIARIRPLAVVRSASAIAVHPEQAKTEQDADLITVARSDLCESRAGAARPE